MAVSNSIQLPNQSLAAKYLIPLMAVWLSLAQLIASGDLSMRACIGNIANDRCTCEDTMIVAPAKHTEDA